MALSETDDEDLFVDAEEEICDLFEESDGGSDHGAGPSGGEHVGVTAAEAVHSLRPAPRARSLADAVASCGFDRVVIFNGTVPLSGNFTLSSEELAEAVAAFGDRAECIKSGLRLDGVQFDVHRTFDHLLYGRTGHDANTVGFALARFPMENNTKFVYVAATFGYPMTTARAVPRLERWCLDVVLPLL
eukprot:c26319_g1_i1.p1 GENE.c26319_g1_i1~~c26319_g1_i1.p1  ORF type:complete len:188 (+),score=26.24 c26319_g1_i1:65-628(+)